CLNMFQTFSAYIPSSSSGKAVLESAILIHHVTTHPTLSSPLHYLTKKTDEISDCLEKIDKTFSSKPPKM
ncbi:MAG: hypothetical protein FWC10_10990, partial [Lentimicrobiaceae bacterium]|nr:hypothetical protein [Lentimicrobiaceae bacterium]